MYIETIAVLEGGHRRFLGGEVCRNHRSLDGLSYNVSRCFLVSVWGRGNNGISQNFKKIKGGAIYKHIDKNDFKAH